VTLEHLINTKRILVVMGPGGVGKTTLAATLGLEAARQSRRALVLTIDPAMRLADALGLGNFSAGDHHKLPEDTLCRAGVPAKRPLFVAMLDTGRSLTDLIVREISDPKRQKRILENPFFDRLCHDLAGSREYAAMEEIHHLHTRGEYDLLIVDTPPTIHGLDFLEAPDRILDVLEYDSYRWLMRPALLTGKLGLKVLDFSGGYVVRTLYPSRSEECRYLNRRLSRRHLAPGAVVVNRVTPQPPQLPAEPELSDKLTRALAEKVDPGDSQAAVTAMLSAHQMLADLAKRDRSRLGELRESLPDHQEVITVPLLEEDVHDIAGLELMRRAVITQGREP